MSVALVEIVEGESAESSNVQDSKSTITPPKKCMNWWLLLLYGTFATVGRIGGPLIQRLYYMHGGTRQWLATWLVSVGVFVMVPPLLFLYFKNYSSKSPKAFFSDPKLLCSSAFIGILIGLDNYMYSAGLSYIPVSTSSLLFSTQLAFTALFAFIIVKQKFTFYSSNSVVVMTFGAIVLALHTSSDRPSGVSKGKYLFGFLITSGGAALLGLCLPLIEWAYSKSSKPINYLMVLQFQFVMNVSATFFATVGMLVGNNFRFIPKEAREFALGETKYYVILVAIAILWQLAIFGAVGIISCTSSLFSGIFLSLLLPITEVAAIITFGEKLTGEKGLSLALCLWGFTSYFIGQYQQSAKTKTTSKTYST